MVVMDNNGRKLDGYQLVSLTAQFFHLKITIFSFFSHEKLQDKFSMCHDVVVTVALP